jgi:hypothetical protein
MEIKIVIDAPKGWERRILLYVMTPIALVAAAAVGAHAYDTSWIQANAPVSAASLKADLDEAQTRLTNIEAKTSRVAVAGVTPFPLTALTFIPVPYSTVQVDDLKEYSTANNRFTALVAGDYQVCASINLPSPAAELSLFVNGARTYAFARSSTTGILEGCVVYRLNAADYMDVRVNPYNPNGTVMSDGNWDWLTISRVR